MKKIAIIILLVLAAALSIYLYSYARNRISLPRPEDMKGQEASSFLPRESKGKPATQGSASLKVTGPVWVEE